MGTKDLHAKPFDASTLAKLEIFEDYAQAWIPTFVMAGFETICIFDLFAGTGYDEKNIAGSPIRILRKINDFISHISRKKTKILVYLNEFKAQKYKLLIEACETFLNQNTDVKSAITIKYSNEDFDVCFNRLLPEITKYPSLVYLDQNGVKFLANKYLIALEKTERTDFLYFVSSSYFIRFGDSEEFKKHVNFDLEQAKKDPYDLIHRNLIDQLRVNLPQNSKLKLYPFSLKKGTNIYGIIFGAKNPRAVDKFLDIAWKRNPINGDANFDIDSDRGKTQLSIFDDKKMTKIESFQMALKEKIKEAQIISNGELYLFTLEKGHPRQHASDYIKSLKRNKIVDYNGASPKITYEGLTKKEESLEIKWVQK